MWELQSKKMNPHEERKMRELLFNKISSVHLDHSLNTRPVNTRPLNGKHTSGHQPSRRHYSNGT